MIFRRAFNIPVPGLIFSILGLLYCIFISVGVGTDVVCLTSGCALVDDFRLFGLSPWWVAAVFFGLMTALSIFRLRALAHAFATLMLLGDLLFLLVMIFLAPCTSCLIATILIFGAWVSLRSRPSMLVTPRRILAGGIGAVWGLLFLLNLGPVLNELPSQMVMQASSEAGSAAGSGANSEPGAAAKVSIYFSPSCPACLEAVRVFGNSAVYYPVAEKESDIGMIADIQERMKAGETFQAALNEVHRLSGADGYAPPQTGLWRGFVLRIALMRNQGKLSAQGFTSLPVIMFEGMPRSWTAGNGTAKQGQEGGSAASQGGEQVRSGEKPSAVAGGSPESAESGVKVTETFIPKDMLKGLAGLETALGSIIAGKAAEDSGEPDGNGVGGIDGPGGSPDALPRNEGDSPTQEGGVEGSSTGTSSEEGNVPPQPPYSPRGTEEDSGGAAAAAGNGSFPEEFAEEAEQPRPVLPESGQSADSASETGQAFAPGTESGDSSAAPSSASGISSEDGGLSGAEQQPSYSSGASDPTAGTDASSRADELSGADLPPDLLEGTIECGPSAPEPCD